MIIKDKIAFFDFCETLVSFQTAIAFIEFVNQNIISEKNCKYKNLYHLFEKIKIFSICRRLFHTFYLEKRIKLLQIRDIEEERIEKLAKIFYETKIKPSLIPETISELYKRKKEGYFTVIVSGGFDVYLKFFCQEFKIDKLLASRLERGNGKFTGKIKGKDCMGKNKISYIKKIFPNQNKENWYAYSDSITDLPLLEYVGKPIVISRDNSQNWLKTNFNEIIWKKQ